MTQKAQERKTQRRKAKRHEARLQAIARKAYDIPELCVAYKVGRSTVYEEIRAGRLKIFKVGKLTRISIEAAAKWRRAREQDATLDPPPVRKPDHPAEAGA